MMEVELDATGKGLSMSEPRLLFEGDFYQDADGHPNYDVAPDGRFLMIERGREERVTELRVIVNWFEELRRLAPPATSRPSVVRQLRETSPSSSRLQSRTTLIFFQPPHRARTVSRPWRGPRSSWWTHRHQTR
jgi:hypothetical protein